jgi:hypothetical protein
LQGRIVFAMFGPLNGVRVGLVAAAVAAAMAALFAGFPFAALILFTGVTLHGLGWMYLYIHRYPDAND